MVTVDEACLAIDDVLQRRDLERIAALHHQSHLTGHEMDHAVFARVEPFPAGPDALRAQFAARQMHAGEIAGALRQRHQRILVADITQIDADTGLAVEQFAQLRNGKTVAGMDADHRRALMQERFYFRGELLGEVFQLRTKARLHALSGPHQLLAERRQRRAFAALGFDQRHAEEVGPLFDQIPDVAVGETGVGRRAGEFAGLPDFVQHPEHHHDRLRAALLPKSPDGIDVDVQHGLPGYEVSFI